MLVAAEDVDMVHDEDYLDGGPICEDHPSLYCVSAVESWNAEADYEGLLLAYVLATAGYEM